MRVASVRIAYPMRRFHNVGGWGDSLSEMAKQHCLVGLQPLQFISTCDAQCRVDCLAAPFNTSVDSGCAHHAHCLDGGLIAIPGRRQGFRKANLALAAGV